MRGRTASSGFPRGSGHHELGEPSQVEHGDAHVLRPLSRQESHIAEGLDSLADARAHLLNHGLSLLSLGTEITTVHRHSNDKLFIDANGLLAVAESKRGQAPREATAQAIVRAAQTRHPHRAERRMGRMPQIHDAASLDPAGSSSTRTRPGPNQKPRRNENGLREAMVDHDFHCDHAFLSVASGSCSSRVSHWRR